LVNVTTVIPIHSIKKSLLPSPINLLENPKLFNILLNGKAEFKMPVNAKLQIQMNGHLVIRRGLFLDYPLHQKMIETFANGQWLRKKTGARF